MPGELRNRAQFLLERLLLRGPQYRLLVIVALIGIISIVGGAIVQWSGGGFGSFGDAVWWAFLRLTDPGYLGDDEGVLRRTVSTILTVLGYVIFLGALIAIMTQWLNDTIRRLEIGLTPISVENHVLILGWTDRTATLVSELLQSEGRVKRFLRRRRARELTVVILAEEITHEMWQELRDRLGRLYDERHLILRSGSALRIEHLRRVAYLDAAAIVLPAADREPGLAEPDTRTVKTLMSISAQPATRNGRPLPLAVAEILDEHKVAVAEHAYAGPLEPLASDSIISRLIAQNVRHPGLSHVYAELLTHTRGNEIYVREIPGIAGERLQDVAPLLPHAIVLGVVRPRDGRLEPTLNPPGEFRVGEEDRLVLIARHFDHTEPEPRSGELPSRGRAGVCAAPIFEAGARRILILGWNHKVPSLLEEFDGYGGESFAVDIASLRSYEDREEELTRRGVQLKRLEPRHIVTNATSPVEMRRLEPQSYDAVVLVGTDRLESDEEADARTILTYMLLRETIGEPATPHVIVELLDAGNAALFRRRQGEVLVSPLVLSHMLAQVVLRHELRAVFDELFGPEGAEIFFHPPAPYGLEGREVSFGEIERAAAARGEIALGVRTAQSALQTTGGLHLNPPRSQSWTLGPDDDIVVLTTYHGAAD